MSRGDASRRSLVDFLSDAFYVAPLTELALLHAAASSLSVGASTFFYVLNSSTDSNRPPDMLAYSLGAALTNGIDPFSTDVGLYSPADKLLSELVLNYWCNFVRAGYTSVLLLDLLLIIVGTRPSFHLLFSFSVIQ